MSRYQKKTLTHPPSSSSPNLYQLLPSTTIHNILPVQTACLAIFLHNLSPCPLWSTSWSGALHLIFHTFLHPISVFFSQHIPIPSQPVCCSINIISSVPSLSLNSLLGTLVFYTLHIRPFSSLLAEVPPQRAEMRKVSNSIVPKSLSQKVREICC